MLQSPGAKRALLAVWFCTLAAIWTLAWLAPGIGLYHDDAVYLVTAKSLASGHGYTIDSLPEPIPQTKYPPVFPVLLALFSLISNHPQWLKLLPVLCGLAWLRLTYRLLQKLGASPAASLLLVGLTASSPMVIFLTTNLMAESLFALFLTATLLDLHDGRPGRAGLMAGLATLTRSAGLPLIVACVLTLLLRRQTRQALRFAAVSLALYVPWLLWVATHTVADPYYGSANYAALNVLTNLSGPEKVRVLAQNALYLFSTPFALLAGWTGRLAVIGTLLVFTWCLFVRRHLVPDLFVALYSLMVLCWMGVPERFIAPIFPLVLWIAWRVPMKTQLRAVVATLAVALGLWAGASRLPNALASGYYTHTGRETANWAEMQRLFADIRANTPPDSIILTNLDPVFYLNTGRKAARAFAPDNRWLFYNLGEETITPASLACTILRTGATHIALTPDRDFAESPAFHASVQKLGTGSAIPNFQDTDHSLLILIQPQMLPALLRISNCPVQLRQPEMRRP